VADRYITPEGLARIRSEYDELFAAERPKIVGDAAPGAAKVNPAKVVAPQ
jgi:hypothetical protein